METVGMEDAVTYILKCLECNWGGPCSEDAEVRPCPHCGAMLEKVQKESDNA